VLLMAFILTGYVLSLKTQQLLDRPCSGINGLVASFVARLRVSKFIPCMAHRAYILTLNAAVLN
jgi:hypothetical protein